MNVYKWGFDKTPFQVTELSTIPSSEFERGINTDSTVFPPDITCPNLLFYINLRQNQGVIAIWSPWVNITIYYLKNI